VCVLRNPFLSAVIFSGLSCTPRVHAHADE
jgi:hypothetical protein